MENKIKLLKKRANEMIKAIPKKEVKTENYFDIIADQQRQIDQLKLKIYDLENRQKTGVIYKQN